MKTTLKDIFAGFLAAEHVIVPLFVKNAGSVKIAGIVIGVEQEIMAEIAAISDSRNSTLQPPQPVI